MDETRQESTQAFVCRLCRYALYMGVLLAFLAVLPPLALSRGVEAFEENNIVEWTQFGLLFATGTALLVCAVGIGHHRELLSLLGVLLYLAAARELDSTFKAMGLHWTYPFVALIVAEGVYLVPRRKALIEQARFFTRSAAFALLWAGFVQSVVIAQLMGHGEFLEKLMGGGYNRAYKRIVEETGELCGYMILVFGAVETIILLRKRAMRSEVTGPTEGDAPTEAP